MYKLSILWTIVLMNALTLALTLAIPGVLQAAPPVVIPAGTEVTIRVNAEITSGKAKTGDVFEGTLSKELVVNGDTLAKVGDPVTGTVTYAKSSGRFRKSGRLSLRLVTINGADVDSNTLGRQGKGHAMSNAAKIGGGAVAGAVIGGVTGGATGAAVGAAAGGAAGTGVAAATGKEEAAIATEEQLTFKVGSKTE